MVGMVINAKIVIRTIAPLLLFVISKCQNCAGEPIDETQGYAPDEGDEFNVIIYDDLLKDGALKPLAKYIKTNSQINQSGECAKDVLRWAKSWKEPWALKMHDANGKLSSGILVGHLQALGHYDECLSVIINDFTLKGKYCLARLPLPAKVLDDEDDAVIRKMASGVSPDLPTAESRMTLFDTRGRLIFKWGICVPATCNAQQLASFLSEILKNLNTTEEVEAPMIELDERDCVVEEPIKLSAGAISAFTVILLFFLILTSSSIYDVLTTENTDKRHRYHRFIVSFSMYTNGHKMQKIDKKSSSLRCIHGIRTMCIGWTMVNHRYFVSTIYANFSTFTGLKWAVTFPATVIVGGAINVDTFLVLSGFLLAYVFFKKHQGKKSFSIPKFYLHRFLRIWPAMAMLVFVQASLLPYFGSGPYWKYSQEIFSERCQKWWWTDLLFVQNYVNPLEPCMGQLWYLCVDMQLYLLSPILLYPLLRNQKIGVINLIFWIVVSQVVVVVISYTNNLGGFMFGTDPEYIVKFYSSTHTRAVPWMIGFAAGYFHHRTAGKKVIMNKYVVIIGWITALVVLWMAVFGVYPMQAAQHDITKFQDGTYNAFARTAWSICIVWLIFACTWGYGGPINWFLSHRSWELIGRITYSMYLLHFGIQVWHVSQQKTTREYSHFYILFEYLGDLFMNFNVAFFWALAFELPFAALEKVAFTKPRQVSSDR